MNKTDLKALWHINTKMITRLWHNWESQPYANHHWYVQVPISFEILIYFHHACPPIFWNYESLWNYHSSHNVWLHYQKKRFFICIQESRFWLCNTPRLWNYLLKHVFLLYSSFCNDTTQVYWFINHCLLDVKH